MSNEVRMSAEIGGKPDATDVLATELGRELRAVQDESLLTGAEIASLVGWQQSWWSMLTSGCSRRPDVEALRRITSLLMLSPRRVNRIVHLATVLHPVQDVEPRRVPGAQVLVRRRRATPGASMTEQRGQVLGYMYRQGKPCYVTRIADDVDICNSVVSRMFDAFVGVGWITADLRREATGPGNARGVVRRYGALTDAGVEALREHVARFGALLGGDLAELPGPVGEVSASDVLGRSLGQLVRRAWRSSGLSTWEVARRVGKPQSWLVFVMQAHYRRPKVDEIERLVSVLSVNRREALRARRLAELMGRV